MNQMTKSGVLTSLVGLSLLAPAWMGFSGTAVPTVIHPLPALTVLPILFIPLPQAFSVGFMIVLPAVLFFAWNPTLFHGSATVPRRSYVLFAVAAGLSVPWFVLGWKFALQYQGSDYARKVCLLNALCVAGLAIMFLRCWKKESTYWASLAVHWMLFAWLGWYAFPYLGELP